MRSSELFGACARSSHPAKSWEQVAAAVPDYDTTKWLTSLEDFPVTGLTSKHFKRFAVSDVTQLGQLYIRELCQRKNRAV